MSDHAHDPALLEKAIAYATGTAELQRLSASRIIPLLKALLQPSDFEIALVSTYYRIHMWMMTMARMNQPADVQTALNAMRAVYELLIDLKLLKKDPSQEARYHAFTFIQRYRAAKLLVDHLNTNKTRPTPRGTEKRRAFVADPMNQKKYDDERRTHWGTDQSGKIVSPEHWSGLGMADRTAQIGWEETLRYREIYSIGNWFVHSGAVGIAGVSPDGVLAGFSTGHARVQEFFIETAEIVCDLLRLFTASEGLREELGQASLCTVKCLCPELARVLDG